MNKQFDRQDQDLNEIARAGSGTINYKVNGYWSGSTISIRVNLKSKFIKKDEVDVNVIANVSHSTGGRDTDELKDDNQATRNFAAALIDAANYSDYINSKSEELSKIFKKELDIRIEETKRQRELEEEKRRKRELDNPPMNLDEAKKLVKDMIRFAEDSDMEFYECDVRSRYTDEIRRYKIEVCVHDRKKFWFNDRHIGRQKLIESLAENYALIK